MFKGYILYIIMQLHVFYVICKEVNLIQLIKTEVSTSMSSENEWNVPSTSWGSNNVIDNVAQGDPNTCSCCSSTAASEPPWLQIDLGRIYNIKEIQITGRPDGSSREQYQDIDVLLSNSSMETTNGSLVYRGNAANDFMFKLRQQPSIRFRYLMIRRSSLSYLTICEVELFEASINLLDRIRGRVSIKQSSILGGTYKNTSFGPFNAIDGKENYSIDVCECCIATNHGPSWWQINLRDRYSVDRLEIFGRSDLGNGYSKQMQDARVYAGNTSLIRKVNRGVFIYVVPTITKTTHFEHQLEEQITAQFFIVSLSSSSLTLCEFILYGKEPKCSLGSFGKSCAQKCHCADADGCDVWTGKCQTPLCSPGWTGPACDKVCDSRNFGFNCTSTCHCLNNTNCNSTTGECYIGLCDSGWQGSSCDAVCETFLFGNNCSSTCHCLNGTNCNSTTGECYIGLCDFGWQGSSCDQVCDNRNFGYNCSSACHCLNNTNCNSTTGECYIGFCDSGWQGPSCDQACDHRSFGYNCSSTCNCLNNTNCNITTGDCYIGLCDSGWQGPKCDQESSTETEIDPHTSTVVIGGSVAGCIVVIVIMVLLSVHIYKHRMNQVKRNGNDNYFKSINRTEAETTYDKTGISRESKGETNKGVHVHIYENFEFTGM